MHYKSLLFSPRERIVYSFKHSSIHACKQGGQWSLFIVGFILNSFSVPCVWMGAWLVPYSEGGDYGITFLTCRLRLAIASLLYLVNLWVSYCLFNTTWELTCLGHFVQTSFIYLTNFITTSVHLLLWQASAASGHSTWKLHLQMKP